MAFPFRALIACALLALAMALPATASADPGIAGVDEATEAVYAQPGDDGGDDGNGDGGGNTVGGDEDSGGPNDNPTLTTGEEDEPEPAKAKPSQASSGNLPVTGLFAPGLILIGIAAMLAGFALRGAANRS